MTDHVTSEEYMLQVTRNYCGSGNAMTRRQNRQSRKLQFVEEHKWDEDNGKWVCVRTQRNFSGVRVIVPPTITTIKVSKASFPLCPWRMPLPFTENTR